MITTTQLHGLGRRFILTGVLAGALTALAAPAANADPSQLARPGHGYAAVRVPAMGGSPLAHSSQAMPHWPPAQSFRQELPPVPPSVTAPAATVATSSGFAWRAAAVGAGIATITLVLIGAALQTTRARRTPPARPA
jgi:hypothetical protein